MGIAQMSALGPGRRMKRPYVDEINARTPYLPQLYAQSQEKKYQTERLGLANRQFQQDKRFKLENLKMQEDMAHQARKKHRLAQNLGYANIGMQGALGGYEAMGQPSLSDIGDWFSGDSGGWDMIDDQTFAGVDDLFSGGGGFGGGLFEGLFEGGLDWSDMI